MFGSLAASAIGLTLPRSLYVSYVEYHVLRHLRHLRAKQPRDLQCCYERWKRTTYMGEVVIAVGLVPQSSSRRFGLEPEILDSLFVVLGAFSVSLFQDH